MKLLTLNTHSLEEPETGAKRVVLADFIAAVQPDVIALQEVNQTAAADPAGRMPAGYVPVQQAVEMKEDNYALGLHDLLEERQVSYHWTWLPMKIGYDKYDEGLAVFSKKPILKTADLLVSKTEDYHNYRTRRILGIRTEDGWFFDVHMSWWHDPVEPFAPQWKRLKELLPETGRVYLMGDFNGDAAIRHETYDAISQDGWQDTWLMAEEKDAGWTVAGSIDGWRDQQEVPARRIDQIWASQSVRTRSSRVCFNGENEPVISDHFGILAEVDA